MRHGTDGELGERLTRARSERDELPAGEIDAPHGPAANDRRTVGTGSRLPAYPDRTGGRNLDLGAIVESAISRIQSRPRVRQGKVAQFLGSGRPCWRDARLVGDDGAGKSEGSGACVGSGVPLPRRALPRRA